MVSATGRCRFVRDKNKQHAKITSTRLQGIYACLQSLRPSILDKMMGNTAQFVNK
jgi:GTP cyclohydrolase I